MKLVLKFRAVKTVVLLDITIIVDVLFISLLFTVKRSQMLNTFPIFDQLPFTWGCKKAVPFLKQNSNCTTFLTAHEFQKSTEPQFFAQFLKQKIGARSDSKDFKISQFFKKF